MKELLFNLIKKVARDYNLIAIREKDVIKIMIPYTDYVVVKYRLYFHGFVRDDDIRKRMLKYPEKQNDGRTIKAIKRHIERNINKYSINEKQRKILYHMKQQNIAENVKIKVTPNVLFVGDLDGNDLVVDRESLSIIDIVNTLPIQSMKQIIEWLSYYSFCMQLEGGWQLCKNMN